jgi:nitronate monooxygenase
MCPIVNGLLQTIGVALPIVQAPMAGVATPEMAAAVSNAGALGSIGIGGADAGTARKMIAEVREATDRPFNVNVFCHRPAVADSARESAWLARLAPEFARYGGTPPQALRERYTSFVENDAMFEVILEERPRVVSFHFGLPPAEKITALRRAGIFLLATATSLSEARAVAAAGVDAVVAQGFEAGGHRGVFDPEERDEQLGTIALTRMLSRDLDIPVIAAGGVMDGPGIAACLLLGAAAAQLGTAFIACPESQADAGYRSALLDGSARTVMTKAISGRPARCIANRMTAIGENADARAVPAYPIAYDAAKALDSVARSRGETGFGAHWAGQGAPLARQLPAATLVAQLCAEMARALAVRPWRTPTRP